MIIIHYFKKMNPLDIDQLDSTKLKNIIDGGQNIEDIFAFLQNDFYNTSVKIEELDKRRSKLVKVLAFLHEQYKLEHPDSDATDATQLRNLNNKDIEEYEKIIEPEHKNSSSDTESDVGINLSDDEEIDYEEIDDEEIDINTVVIEELNTNKIKKLMATKKAAETLFEKMQTEFTSLCEYINESIDILPPGYDRKREKIMKVIELANIEYVKLFGSKKGNKK